MNDSPGNYYAMADRGTPIEPAAASCRVTPAEQDTPQRDRSRDTPAAHVTPRKVAPQSSLAPRGTDSIEISDAARRAFEQTLRSETP